MNFFSLAEEDEAVSIGERFGYNVHPMVHAIGVTTPRGRWQIYKNCKNQRLHLRHENEYIRTLKGLQQISHQYHAQTRSFPTIEQAFMYIKAHDECRYTYDKTSYIDPHESPKASRHCERRLEKASGKHIKDKERRERVLRKRGLCTEDV